MVLEHRLEAGAVELTVVAVIGQQVNDEGEGDRPAKQPELFSPVPGVEPGVTSDPHCWRWGLVGERPFRLGVVVHPGAVADPGGDRIGNEIRGQDDLGCMVPPRNLCDLGGRDLT